MIPKRTFTSVARDLHKCNISRRSSSSMIFANYQVSGDFHNQEFLIPTKNHPYRYNANCVRRLYQQSGDHSQLLQCQMMIFSTASSDNELSADKTTKQSAKETEQGNDTTHVPESSQESQKEKHHKYGSSFKSTWRVYLPGAVTFAIWYGVVYFIQVNATTVKKGHDFLPIYSEDGKLEGFTHPVLVEAGNSYREKIMKENQNK
eukprot:Tbor_TRINITY_DN3828_c0_g1::TRINITY_DN3828_c0_g1_i2::g.5655::m.5655